MKFLLFFLTLGSLFASPKDMQLRHVYLTWQHDPCRTMTVTAHGIQTPNELILYYDTKPHHAHTEDYAYQCKARGEQKIRLPDRRLIYHMELTELTPDTTYYFSLGFGKEFSFHTMALQPPYRFVEGGDWENTEAAAQLAKRAADCQPHAVLLGGDYASAVFGPSDYAKWDQWLDVYRRTMVSKKGHLIPFVMAIGNHEVIGGYGQPKRQVPFFFHYFCQGDTQKSYFSLPFGEDVRLFVLDSGHTEKHDGEQLAWLQAELMNSQSCPIKLALYHVPLYPSIRFTEKGLAYRAFVRMLSAMKVDNPAVRLFSYASLQGKKHWLPLFDRHGMTVAFEHHDQTLKRTKLLRGGKPHPQGTLYLGDGGWGARLQYPPIQGVFKQHFAHLKGKEHFFWLVEIEKEGIAYSAINESGLCLDHYHQRLKCNTR